jgi:pimeloyl-ACP methyl ester carboxylesterase
MGQDFSCFQKFAQTFDNQYTTYLFDLPFHGKSEVKESIITKEIWKEYLNKILVENQIKNFSIISFSMGGRFALATLEAFSERIEEGILLAPDGVTEDPFYVLATRFGFTRKIFKKVVHNQHKFHGFASMLARVGITDNSVLKFAKMMVDTSEKREQLIKAWIGFHQLKFDMKKLSQLINNQKVTIRIFMGKYDKLLPIQNVYPLTKHLENKEFIILESSHARLVDKTTDYLKSNRNNNY